MKKLLLLFLFVGFWKFSSAQLSGTYTVGGINPDFNNLLEISNILWYPGISGDVVFNIRPGVYNESVEIVMNELYSVTFQSENGDSSSVIITCDSCDNALDLHIPNCIVKNLTISTSNSNQSALRKSGGNRLYVESCVVKGIWANTDTIIAKNNEFIADATNNFLYCDSLLLANNHFYAGANCHYSDKGIIVGNYFDGVVNIGHSDKINVKENYFEKECSILFSDSSLVVNNIFNNEFRFHCLESEIIGNDFRYSDEDNYVNHIVYSNNINFSNNILFGITDFGFCPWGEIFNNFFLNGVEVGYSSNLLMLNNNFGNCPYCYLKLETSDCIVKNNNFSKSVYGWIYNNTIENNNYYPSGGLYDLSPTNLDPQYIDTIDIHAQNPQLAGIGIYLPQVQFDIDSLLRPNPPTIGANEICLSRDTLNLFCGDSIVLSFCNTPLSGTFVWNTSDGLNNSTSARPKVSPSTNTLYILTEMQSGFTDSVFVNVIPYQVEAFSDTMINCGDSIYLFASYNASANYQWTPNTGLYTPNSVHTIAKPDETIDYVVSASIPGCGISYDTITVTVNPLPRAFASYSDSCLTVSFNNTSTCAIDYYWDFGDSVTSTEFNPSHTYDTSGVYLITMIAYNSYGSDTIFGNISINCVTSPSGIKELGSKIDIIIYPNPATTEITINGYNPNYLKLFNALGECVAEAKKTNKLWVGNLAPGLYLLQVFNEKGWLVKTEKVIKE